MGRSIRGTVCTGFTLIEVFVSVGIITALVSLLLPSVAKARREARIAACASNLRSIIVAMNNYAIENDGQYPTMPMPQTGGNLWDVSHEFYNVLIKQGLSHETFFCPAAQDRATADSWFARSSTIYILDYNVWMPRLNGPDVVPPSQKYAGSRFRIVQPRPLTPFAGPATMGDPLAVSNPLITDFAGSNPGVTPSADADASVPGNPYGFDCSLTNHMSGYRLLGTNQAFADGHVAASPPSALRPYYLGESWNWR